MSNHISIKLLGFIYAPIPKEIFNEKLSLLTDSLRRFLPRNESPSVSGVSVNIDGGSIATQRQFQGQVLHMVDAEGLWGVKIGDTGISFSTSQYVSYNDVIVYIESILGIVVDVLNITHFSRVTLRNINLFNEIKNEPNRFEDIKDEAYWGRQNFDTLQNKYLCNGASTRHEYFSSDFLTQIQLASGVVMEGQSHIPQEEWDIWRLRGSVPVQKEVAKLVVDISGTRFQAPINIPEKQNNVAEYTWEKIRESFDHLHEVVNNVYSDIIKE